jgi:hypothetical protein
MAEPDATIDQPRSTETPATLGEYRIILESPLDPGKFGRYPDCILRSSRRLEPGPPAMKASGADRSHRSGVAGDRAGLAAD